MRSFAKASEKWEFAIESCIPHADYKKAIEIHKAMEDHIGHASDRAWRGLFRTYVMAGDWETPAEDIRRLSKQYNSTPSKAVQLSPQTFEVVILATAKAHDFHLAEDLLWIALETIRYPTFASFLALINKAEHKRIQKDWWVWKAIRTQASLKDSSITRECLKSTFDNKKFIGDQDKFPRIDFLILFPPLPEEPGQRESDDRIVQKRTASCKSTSLRNEKQRYRYYI